MRVRAWVKGSLSAWMRASVWVWLKRSVLGVGEGVCLSVDEGYSLGVVEVVSFLCRRSGLSKYGCGCSSPPRSGLWRRSTVQI